MYDYSRAEVTWRRKATSPFRRARVRRKVSYFILATVFLLFYYKVLPALLYDDEGDGDSPFAFHPVKETEPYLKALEQVKLKLELPELELPEPVLSQLDETLEDNSLT